MALCPVCDTASSTASRIERCAQCGSALVLGPGYTLERLLGAGGQSRVYAGRLNEGALVAIKILSLSRVKDPKALELFRRSAEVLASLSHSGIAKQIAYFEETRPHAALYCLVQELIPGDTLAKAGRFDEAGAKAVALQVLATLSYLHGLSPPVIHRDIKPSNLMRKPDGSIVLIDFDLVRDVLRPDGGSTLSIGTPGFTPMEQYMGDATAATDLYALGVTLAVLLARKDPTEMRGTQRLELRKHINASDGFLRVLEKLTEPEPARRFQSANEVMRALELPPTPASPRRPMAAMATGMAAVFVMIALGVGLASLSNTHEQAPAAVIPKTVPETKPVAVEPVKAPEPTPPSAPAPALSLSSERDAHILWSALAPNVWQGTAEGRPVRIAFNGPFNQARANVLGSASAVDFSSMGVITVKRTEKRADTVTQETYFLRLSSDLTMLVGTLETQFSSGTSTYETNANITLRRSQ